MFDSFTAGPLAALLKLSWEAAVLIVLVLAAQWTLGRRMSPRWRHALWLLVVLRLALPWTIASPASLFNYLKFSGAVRSHGSQLREPSDAAPAEKVAPPVAPPSSAGALSPSSPVLLLPLIWLTGAVGLQIWMLVAHGRIARRVTRRRPLTDARILNLLEDCKQLMGVRAPVLLVETPGVDAPCLFGFIRPRVLLPEGFTSRFSPEEIRYVFLHELSHVKRNDIPLGWVMAFLQILHWFNPLVWLAFARIRAERELACDAMALSYAGERASHPYGQTIVKLLEGFGDSLRLPSLAGIVEGNEQIKERIRMIAKFKNANHGAALAGILFLGLGALTLTDAQNLASSDKATAPPKIVKTEPAAGATNVSPSLNEITVTFDRDMGGGFSWTGGGPDYPPSPKDAKAHWLDKRTAVLPVILEAGRYYRVGINSKSYKSFRSARGVPAMPSAIYFTTEGASEELRARVLTPHIVTLAPENGATNVDPAVNELRVTFDIPMGGGFSWCTAGDDDRDYPKGRAGEETHWTKDKMTCVMPVTLQSGMTYRISLNAAQFKNFQSDGGVPLEPVDYSFTTSGPAQPPTSGTNWEAEQQGEFKDGNIWAAYNLWDAYHRGNNGVKPNEDEASKWLGHFIDGVWVVKFEPVGDFAPATPEEFLKRISDNASTYSGQNDVGLGSFFRTTKQNGKLVGSFLCNDVEEFKARLAKVPGVKFISAQKMTPENFGKYEESPQESL